MFANLQKTAQLLMITPFDLKIDYFTDVFSLV